MNNKEELLSLLELNKLDSRYAEIINILIYILGLIIFFILINHITIIESLSFLCSYYIITKLLYFMMFGSRLKRVKERRNIRLNINNLN